MKIRTAVASDAPEIFALGIGIPEINYSHVVPFMTPDELKDAIASDDAFFAVATSEGQIVGYIAGRPASLPTSGRVYGPLRLLESSRSDPGGNVCLRLRPRGAPDRRFPTQAEFRPGPRLHVHRSKVRGDQMSDVATVGFPAVAVGLPNGAGPIPHKILGAGPQGSAVDVGWACLGHALAKDLPGWRAHEPNGESTKWSMHTVDAVRVILGLETLYACTGGRPAKGLR